ncbi:MAG: hypothetical protein M1830_005995, partial [Pleopsidium flavum]
MSSGGVLQLFPSSSPHKTGPKRKGSRRYPVKPQSPEPIIEEIKALDDGANAVVIQVIEDSRVPSPISALPQAHVAERSRSNTPTSQLSERRGAASPAPLRAASPADSLNRSARSASATLVRSNSAASTTDTRSPLMQSIFPRYNPSVPLSQQRYYPDTARGASPTNLPREVVSKAEYSPWSYSPGSAGRITKHGYAEGPKTAPASVINFTEGVLEKITPKYSSVEELGGLWEAANGQSGQKMPESFRLQISRWVKFVNITLQNFDIDIKSRANLAEPATESWTFGPSASKPFYDLQAHTTSELTIRRHHPQKPSTIVPIAVLNLEPSTRHLPPQDGLVTLIFPKLAALLAMDQATSTASKYGLPQTDCESLTSEAVARAADKDACKLRWDADSNTYQLIHPTLTKGIPQIFSIVIEDGAGFGGTGNAKGRIALRSPNDSTFDL